MKKILTSILLLFIYTVFAIFVYKSGETKTVLEVLTPTKAVIDLNGNSTADGNETICIDNIEAFTLEPEDNFVQKYSKSLNLTRKDIIGMGYLAREYSQNLLENQKVKVRFTNKVSNECRYANIEINGTGYSELLGDSGFGLVEGKPANTEKYNANLAAARKLNLVILNHTSGKYHEIDCPYGLAATDNVYIPMKHLPKNSSPCKFCHKTGHKTKFKKGFGTFNVPNIPTPPLFVTDGNIRAGFTDFTKNLKPDTGCKTSVCKEFVKLIDGSKSSVDIAIYGYNEIPAITASLKRAKARGVKIRFVYDENYNPEKTFYQDNKIIADLSSVSRSDRSENKTQSNFLMHNKFIIFDKETVFTGSMNISPTGMSGYDVNNIVIIKSAEIAKLYEKEFEQMLSGKFHINKSKLNENNVFKFQNGEIEVYFSPKDKASTRIGKLIKNAKKNIYVPTFLLTHEAIANELVAAKQRGVDVRIILDANGTSTRNSKHTMLRNAGILLKTENYAGKLHAKTMIIDDEYLITGSMNFSNSGENKNDENLLVIKNEKIAKAHKNFFLYLWTKIPNKYLKYNARPESPESIGSCFDGVDNNFNGKIDGEEELCKVSPKR